MSIKTFNNMKTKTIPFDLETAKKIQAGELKGKIKTRDGKDVRVICWDRKDFRYPIVALVNYIKELQEFTFNYTNKGSVFNSEQTNPDDLVLEVPDTEPQFKPFDKVLVRDEDDSIWKAGLFSHIDEKGEYYVGFTTWKQCIPFEGNEHLVGTTDNPKED